MSPGSRAKAKALVTVLVSLLTGVSLSPLVDHPLRVVCESAPQDAS